MRCVVNEDDMWTAMAASRRRLGARWIYCEMEIEIVVLIIE